MEEKKIKVSVVVPVFNSEKHLRVCLGSILRSTFSDFEVICVDDGSKDTSLEILNSYARQYPNFKVLSVPHRGVAAARNTGMDVAQGEYIQFVDADDWISDNLLSDAYAKAKKDDLDLVCFNVANYDDKTKLLMENQFYPASYWPMNAEEVVLTWKNYKNMFNGNFSVVNKFYKTEFLRKNNIRFIESLHFEDHPFHLESFLSAKKIGVINSSMYFYRKNVDNSFMMKMGQDKRIFDMFRILDEHRKILDKLELFERLRVFYFEYVVGILLNMFFNSASWFMKPKFYSKIKEYFKKINDNEDDYLVVMHSRMMIEYTDVLSCSWLLFLVKYNVIEFGRKLLVKIQKMK